MFPYRFASLSLRESHALGSPRNPVQQATSEVTRPRHGFTLIELLAVIAIIGVLVAILIPVVGKVRSKMHSAECASNLRQLTAAGLLYSMEHKGDLPQPLPKGGEPSWPTTLAEYVDKPLPLVAEKSVMTCPVQFGLHPQARTYSLNRQMDLTRQRGGGEGPVKMMVMNRPGELEGIPMFMDGVYTSRGSWRVWRSWAESQVSENNFPHTGACNMSFLDGHVEQTRSGEGIWAGDKPLFVDGKPVF